MLLSQTQAASLLPWLAHHPLRQLQCSAAFHSLGQAEADSLLPMLLASMVTATPHLRALRIDAGEAADQLSNGHLPLIATLAPALRQLAILDCREQTSTSICTLIGSLTNLQDLALRIDDLEVSDDGLEEEPPFLDMLLSAAASSCLQLHGIQ